MEQFVAPLPISGALRLLLKVPLVLVKTLPDAISAKYELIRSIVATMINLQRAIKRDLVAFVASFADAEISHAPWVAAFLRLLLLQVLRAVFEISPLRTSVLGDNALVELRTLAVTHIVNTSVVLTSTHD